MEFRGRLTRNEISALIFMIYVPADPCICHPPLVVMKKEYGKMGMMNTGTKEGLLLLTTKEGGRHG